MLESGRVRPFSVGLTLRVGAPYGLWVFGEHAEPLLSCDEEDVEMASRLFPEANGRFWRIKQP